MTGLRSVAETHVGYVRTNNEDLAVTSSDLVAVADGMGGHLGGEVAARIAIDELVKAFQAEPTGDGLVDAVRQANEAIWRRSKADRGLHGMGTTITAAALVGADDSKGSCITLVNVGDSRGYMLDRSDAEAHLVQLTTDHSVVEEMVHQGEISEAEAAVHPHRHVLTRVLGVESGVAVDAWELDASVGLRLLLCSDGLSDEVPPEEIEQGLSPADPREAARQLVSLALAHGGSDNVTVVVVDVVEAPEQAGQPVELVPPDPPEAVPGADLGRQDVTQAVTVTGASPGEGPGAERAAPFDAEATAGPPSDGEGRSMTMRGEPAATSAPAPSPHRAMVLVPAKRLAKAYRDRVVTFRVVIFVLVLAALLGGVFAVVLWFQRSSYFVGLSGDRVSVYEGRPGGLLWFKPQLLWRSDLTTSGLLPNSTDEVRNGISESSYAAARQQVHDLSKLSGELGLKPAAPSQSKSPSVTSTTTASDKAFYLPGSLLVAGSLS